MGFFSRRVDCGSLDILPERDSCLPGEAISGVVMLHLTRPLTDACEYQMRGMAIGSSQRGIN
jgi:hypothetical protein